MVKCLLVATVRWPNLTQFPKTFAFSAGRFPTSRLSRYLDQAIFRAPSALFVSISSVALRLQRPPTWGNHASSLMCIFLMGHDSLESNDLTGSLVVIPDQQSKRYWQKCQTIGGTSHRKRHLWGSSLCHIDESIAISPLVYAACFDSKNT